MFISSSFFTLVVAAASSALVAASSAERASNLALQAAVMEAAVSAKLAFNSLAVSVTVLVCSSIFRLYPEAVLCSLPTS